MTGSSRHIAIIGAGLSGLRCADILAQNGFQVTIFEGRDRIGGRIHQIQLKNGKYVDMGANWIHGTNGNTILDIANATRTSSTALDNSSNSFDEFGVRFPSANGTKYETILWDIIGEAFEYSKQKGSEIDPSKSLLDYFKEKIPEYIPDTEAEYEKHRQITLQMCESWGAFIGTRIARQSLKFFWLEECIDGGMCPRRKSTVLQLTFTVSENLFCSGSYKKILEYISKPVLSNPNIYINLNSTVTKISYKAAGKDSVHLRLSDGKELEFDQVVVTTPLGWLQKNKASAFEPSLPAELSSAIDAISYGCLEKASRNAPAYRIYLTQ